MSLITRRKLLVSLPALATTSLIGRVEAAEDEFANVRNTYYGYFDEEGNSFSYDALAQRHKAWYDVLYKCYPFLGQHALGTDYDYAAIYESHHYPMHVIYDMGTENFEDLLISNLRQFQSHSYQMIEQFGLKKRDEVESLSSKPYGWLYDQVGMFYATP